ncbi:hypothetical protein O3G_MSEX000392 [Manduca sexta]|nr:hypothetical protein O3G_MSEX000392 [Manduca sexta]
MNKDQKKGLMEKILVPENFQLVKASKLNPEIAAVLIESTKNRDKRLEKAQNHLGLGIASLTNLIAFLIEKDMDKLEIIKGLSEANQILLDLHFENTLNRRKLITYSLDKKKNLDIVQEVQRDSMLFGENLTEKIKASKSAEKSGLQIKKTNEASTSSNIKNQQGNRKGPPRQAQCGVKRGGARNRPTYQPARRPTPTTSTSDRFQEQSRTYPKPPNKTR